MALIPILLILLAFLSLSYVSLSFFVSTSKNKIKILIKKLNIEGSAKHLTFCSQEILQNKVLGVDGIHRKIMILEKKKDGYYSSIISLDEVHDCQVVTKSSSAETLELQFEFNNHTQPASIVFTNGIFNSQKEFAFLKAKAEYWCIMFSKMLTPQMEVRA